MGPERFDAVAKLFATSPSRRKLLKGLAGGAAGALGLIGPRVAGAVVCREVGRHCNKHVKCCSGFCDPGTRRCGPCTTNADCDDGDLCTYDVCGAVSHRCFHDPIPDCAPCAGQGECPNGRPCCGGRCCPAGSTSCNGAACCQPCGSDSRCCELLGEQLLSSANCRSFCDSVFVCCTGSNCSCNADCTECNIESPAILR
jgi:hypothetical protein